jgi:DNA-binding HxlR family transcriptional regulator
MALPKLLSKELKDLEINKLIVRKVYDSMPVKVTRKLSDYGYKLVPLIIELTNWGKAHREKIMNKN